MANDTSFQNVDFQSGTKIFAAMTFCPCQTSLKLLTFVKQMFNSHSPRVLIKTVVDTIQSGIIENREIKKNLNKLYLALEKEYDLLYGKVLIALLSKEELKEMLNKGWPFFVKYSQELDLCLNGTSCDSLNAIIATLGEKIFISHEFHVPFFRF